MASELRDLKKNIAWIADAEGYECVGVDCVTGRGSAALRIYIDSRDGVRHADCARVSRAVSEYMDREESECAKFFKGKYLIEVSSPGIERPLFTEEHYARFTGSRVILNVRGRGKLRGVILSYADGKVTLRAEDGGETPVMFADITKGRIIV